MAGLELNGNIHDFPTPHTVACVRMGCGSDKHRASTFEPMDKTYYNPADLKKFGKITEFQKELGEKFFDYYGDVFKEGALTAREKALIALGVAHAIQCPYCIDAYTTDTIERGCSEAQLMEAVHVAAAIRGGASLVHGVQMMNKAKEMVGE